jgi:general secretion pathway protein G
MSLHRPLLRAGRGFTLVELLVVMAVLGVLATMALPMAELAARRERERELKQALWQIREAIDEYHRAVRAGRIAVAPGEPGYPSTLHSLVEGVPDVMYPGRRLYFLRRLPRDPFAEPGLPAEATWALRSYAAPPERPAPGVDVFDVASRSNATGLNGVPLRLW